jgi:hypothetical protein
VPASLPCGHAGRTGRLEHDCFRLICIRRGRSSGRIPRR